SSFLESQSVGTGKTINVTGLTLGDGTGAAANYSLSGGTFDVTQRPVTLTTSRNFDNTKDVDAANLTVTFNNLVGSETLSLSGLGSVSSENVAAGQQAITLGTLALSDNTGVASNYSLSSATLDINTKSVSLSGTKVYDALTTAAAGDFTISGTVGGQDLTLTGNGTLTAGADVGTNKTVNTTGLTLGNGVSGTPGTASNYSLVGGTYHMTVTQRPVTISGSRFYDSTTTVSSSDINTFNNTAGGQTLTLSGVGSIATAVAGAGKTLTLGTLTLADGTGSASNYSLASGTFDVDSRQVNISGSRIYDGTTVINGSDLVVTTGVGSEILTVSGTGSIASANVANNKSVTTGSLVLSGSSGNASNYSIGTITINVTERPVNVSMEKLYDGSLNAPASALKSGGITNTVLGHTLSLTGTGVMSTKDVGVGKTVSVGTLSLVGAQSANYKLAGGTIEIDVNPRTTNASGSRHYDGTTVAGSSAFTSFSNTVGSDTLSLSGLGTIASVGVGSKGVSIGTLSSAHPNYILGNATLTITQRPVNLSGSRITGNGDNSTNIDASKLRFTNIPNNETLNLSGVGKINSISPGTHNIDLYTLVMSNGTGLISNYTFTGGSRIFRIISGLKTKAGVLRALQLDSGNNRKLLPSKTSHRTMPAVSERVTVSTPDQSITVNPCVLKNGYCN
ncbi:MAG: beta strand repeat-containing protein, partial [Alphaproteobacteria bacterium]